MVTRATNDGSCNHVPIAITIAVTITITSAIALACIAPEHAIDRASGARGIVAASRVGRAFVIQRGRFAES